jgi:hypothetical protein
MLSIRIRNTAIPVTIDVPVIITVRKKHIIGDFEVFFEVSRLFGLIVLSAARLDVLYGVLGYLNCKS